ncbi:MAG: hypothetical protein AB7P04_08385 [Bacteriovoracia bacterium]
MADNKAKKSKHKAPKGKPKTLSGKVKALAASLAAKKKPASKPEAKAEAPKKTKKGTGLPVTALQSDFIAVKEKAAKGTPMMAGKSKVDTDICREVACEGLATSGGYCRLHYVKNWKKIKRKELILKEGKLNRYIEELVAKYPDKYIEAIRQDLAGDREFSKVVSDLELDESIEDFERDMENVDNLIDSIRRDVDDDGDIY